MKCECKNCMYFKVLQDDKDSAFSHGLCHRLPPARINMADEWDSPDSYSHVFVFGDDWCGEWTSDEWNEKRGPDEG